MAKRMLGGSVRTHKRNMLERSDRASDARALGIITTSSWREIAVTERTVLQEEFDVIEFALLEEALHEFDLQWDFEHGLAPAPGHDASMDVGSLDSDFDPDFDFGYGGEYRLPSYYEKFNHPLA